MFLSLLARILTWTLSLRYRITWKNNELFDDPSSVVVFPNHPALVDPIILISHLTRQKILSPLMTETYFRTPGIGPIVRSLGAIPVGDIERGGSSDAVKSSLRALESAIQEQRNILLYPSGHIYVQPFEHILGKKMAYEVVGKIPDTTRIIVIRTRGLWGSIWSKADTGYSPDLPKILLRSLWFMLVNFLFFIPKREVMIECVDMTHTLREWHKEGLDIFNQKLQDFYNQQGNEECTFIPHYWFYNDAEGKKEPENIAGSLSELNKRSVVNKEDIAEDVLERIKNIVLQVKQIEPERINFDTKIILDLHADSLDMAELKSLVQSEFPHASNPPINSIKTVGDLAAMAVGKLEGEEKFPSVYFSPVSSELIDFSYQKGDTILSGIKQNFCREKDAAYIYDTTLGSLTRDQFLLRSYVIAEYLKRYQGNKIALMMPALTASSLLLVGVYLADKIPVMLNWTVGEKSFAHCMNLAETNTILTSRKFYEKLSLPWLREFESKMVFIEDIIRDISLSTKIIALLKKKLFLIPQGRKEAVMLFTSGSESLPKAVVLTHENILSDIAGSLALVPFHKYETLLGFLPPFHSFGFTINTIFPLVAPVQAVYSPDPNDARTLGILSGYTHPSIISATPTFLRMILSRNESDAFESLRYAFVGAEKCSDEVFTLFHDKCPRAVLLEGYGITECSPVVTVNTASQQKKGSAGKFLSQVEFSIRSLENQSINKTGESGMIYVAGSSIFGGYIDPTLESPFDEFDGKKWYKTGDLGYVDEDGFLYITGRLKRFVKIAGEMISLPAIETILLEKYGNPEAITIALEAKEVDGNTKIVLFTTFDVSTEEVNEYIHTHGVSNLAKISLVQNIQTIPVLGTGKVDYKSLKSQI